MTLVVAAGSGNQALAQSIASHLGLNVLGCELARFPDGELHVELTEPVQGADVYLLQSTGPSVDEHLFELFLLADACRRSGAHWITAIIPYFGYARQDRRTEPGQPVSARVVADCLAASGVGRIIAVDLHSAPIEGFFSLPIEHLSAVHILAEAARRSISEASVVVAPDLGAVKLADQYARLLGLPSAVVYKTRTSGETVVAERVVGDVNDRSPIIVDDMISTGGTIEAAVNAVIEAGGRPPVTVVSTHGLFVGGATARLQRLELERLIVTDTLPAAPVQPPSVETVSVSDLIAECVSRLHEGTVRNGGHLD